MDTTIGDRAESVATNRAEPGGVLTTRVGLRIPADLSFEDWERTGNQLSGIVDSSSWWLGDWLVYGKRNYSDRYRKAIQAVGLQYQTLRNYAWVARRFEPDRRRPRLTFQHHAEVASLPLHDQESWLDRAEQSRWTSKQLRANIRHEPVDALGVTDRTSVIPRIPVLGRRLVRWRRAAERIGIEFETWVLSTLDHAAETALSETSGTEVEPKRLSGTPEDPARHSRHAAVAPVTVNR
jgi:hypothetical protein